MTEQLTTAPAVLPAGDWTFPVATDSVLDNGMRVLAYDMPGQHVVAVSLRFAVPLSAEPRDKEGVAGLTGECLSQGAGELDAEEFADALALCGADVSASAAADAFLVRMSTPTTRLDDAMVLFAEAVTKPAFLSDEFDNEKRLRLQEIEQSRAYPQHVASEQLNLALLGDSRVARPMGGTTSTVENVTRDDVVAYAERHLQPRTATLIIAGDFSAVDPVAVVTSSLGRWQHAGASPEEATPPVVCRDPQVLLVDWPDAPQATVRLAGGAVSRADERWPALFVANYAVGGNFSSRLNTVLREEKGVTYGVGSTLDTGRGVGVMTVSTAVRSDAAAQSVEDIVSIIRDAAQTLKTDEVESAVRAATDSAAPGFERADAVVSRVEMLLAQNLPLDHVDRNLARIREVTVDIAGSAYADIVDADGLTVLVVGDAATLREPLAAWGYAEPREVTPEPR